MPATLTQWLLFHSMTPWGQMPFYILLTKVNIDFNYFIITISLRSFVLGTLKNKEFDAKIRVALTCSYIDTVSVKPLCRVYDLIPRGSTLPLLSPSILGASPQKIF